jgi:hypothetical protein
MLKYFAPMMPVPRHTTIWPYRENYGFYNSIQKSLQRRGRLKDEQQDIAADAPEV